MFRRKSFLLNHRWLECSVELFTGGVQPYCRHVVCGGGTLPFGPHKMVASISHLGKTRLQNFLRSEGQCIAATIVLSEESFVVIDTSYPCTQVQSCVQDPPTRGKKKDL